MERNFQETATKHRLYLQSSNKNETASAEILKSYEDIMNRLSKEINEIQMQSNVLIQFLGLVLLIEVTSVNYVIEL